MGTKLATVAIGVIAGTALVLSTILLLSCDGVLVTGADAAAECDTTSFTDRGGTVQRTIRCVETVFITDCVDTVYVAVDFDCVEDCLEVNGLGHWRECLEACRPAQ